MHVNKFNDDGKRLLFTRDAKFSATPSTNGGPGVLSGYALVWNEKSTDRGGFKVALSPNSAKFDASSFALWNHDYNQPLARTDNNTLTLASDNYGVKATIQLPNTTAGRDAYELVKTGIVQGMSFGMLLDGAEFTTAVDDDGDEVDTFSSFRADEVTITPIPAFTATSIGVTGVLNHSRDVAAEKENRERQKEYAAQTLKQEEYRLNMYPATLAEHQQKGDAEKV